MEAIVSSARRFVCSTRLGVPRYTPQQLAISALCTPVAGWLKQAPQADRRSVAVMTSLGHADARRNVYGTCDRLEDFLKSLDRLYGERANALSAELDLNGEQCRELALDILRGWRELNFRVSGCLVGRVVTGLTVDMASGDSAARHYRPVAEELAKGLMNESWSKPVPGNMSWEESPMSVREAMVMRAQSKLRDRLIAHKYASALDDVIDCAGLVDKASFLDANSGARSVGFSLAQKHALSLGIVSQLRERAQRQEVNIASADGADAFGPFQSETRRNRALSFALSLSVDGLVAEMRAHQYVVEACPQHVPGLPAARDVTALLLSVIRAVYNDPQTKDEDRLALRRHIITVMPADFALHQGIDATPLIEGAIAPLFDQATAGCCHHQQWKCNLLSELPKEVERFLAGDKPPLLDGFFASGVKLV